MKMYTESDIRKFYTKVAVAGPSDCWEWLGAVFKDGYGTFYFNGKQGRAHRFAFWFSTGVWPEELLICHSCDNPGCVNPTHLWMGTHKDNMQDAVKKGRIAHQKGELHGQAKLTDESVREIRGRYAAGGVSYRQLGSEYGVNHPLIGCIVRRERWAHI